MLLISEQTDLASAHGHHIAGTPYTFRHGWVLLGPRVGQIVEHPQLGKGVVRARHRNGTADVFFPVKGERASFATKVPDNPEVTRESSGFKHVTDEDLEGPAPTGAQKRSMTDYVAPRGSQAINEALRKGRTLPKGNGRVLDPSERTLAEVFGRDGPTPDRNKEIDQLDQLIASHTFRTDAHLYRGMTLSPALKSQFKPGTVFTDKAYTSTSDSMDWAMKFAQMRAGTLGGDMPASLVYGGTPVIMHILAPAGSHAAQGEKDIGEYVMPRGGRYRVDSISPDGGTYNLTFLGAGSASAG